jgi:SagB-type dehydrogenase family enzyme
VRLSEGIVVELHSAALPTVLIPAQRRRVELDFGALAALCQVVTLTAAGREVRQGDLEPDALSALRSLGIVAEADDPRTKRLCRHNMSLLEWATLRMSQVGCRVPRSVVAGRPSPPRFRARDARGNVVKLPEPEAPASTILWTTLLGRQSRRNGPVRQIPLASLSALLTYSLKIQQTAVDAFGDVSYRPVASGGARHPIDAFLLAQRVSGLDPGVYQYDPLDHRLIPCEIAAGLTAELSAAALASLAEVPGAEPAIALFFSAVPARTAWKYKDKALTLIMNDLGCVMQQIYVVVHGLGLCGCAITYDAPERIEAILGLNSTDEVLVGGFLIW